MIRQAAQILRSGGLVAFPTETVYGLGADATNADAVERIFTAKGRPGTNPLIVHVADESIARRYAAVWPEKASQLARAFWPGPLTLVLPKSPSIVDRATAGGKTVGLRVPDHPLALELLRAFGGAVAAPSANRSNRVSPTTAQHVRDELGGSVDLILDGGPCRVGIESTVLDLSGDVPAILRPGGLSRERIEAIIGPIHFRTQVLKVQKSASSPGQLPIHYAPTTPAFRYPNGAEAIPNPGDGKCGWMVIGKIDLTKQWGSFFTMSCRPEDYARHLYEVLRKLDAMGLAAIYVEMPPDTPEWAAVRDRIVRATREY